MGLPVEVNNLMMGSLGGYTVGRSLRFRSSASAYLNRTPASAGNRQKFTWSGWVKRGTLGASAGSIMFSAYNGAANQDLYLAFGSTTGTGTADTLNLFAPPAGNNINVVSAGVYRDTSAWYHIVCAVDTTQATAANRVRLYVNGSEISYGSSSYPSLNQSLSINSTNQHTIGVNGGVTSWGYLDGYLGEINFIDGQQLTPSSFGAYDTNGVWQPKKYTGTYGTNGFYLPFSNTTSTTTLVQDSSGNGNNWTPNNISLTAGTTYDSMIDSPTNSASSSNYAVLNPLDKNASSTLSNANLTSASGTTSWYGVKSSFAVTSGKWYWEVTSVSHAANTAIMIGVADASATLTFPGATANGYGYWSNAAGQMLKYNNNVGATYGTSFVQGDVIGVAFDADAGTITFYVNGVSQGQAFSGITSGPYFPMVGNYSTTTAINFGQRPFSYTPPSGYKALNTYNLPAPSIANGAQYFDATKYTGTGAAQTIVNSGLFQPDFVWMKSRSAAGGNFVSDSVRGTTKVLLTESTIPDATGSQYLTSFNSNGFSIGTDTGLNSNGVTYIGWQWKGGGTAVTNTSGTITSTVSANPSAGFSIVTYSGNGTNGATVGHGLGVKPDMIIIKGRNASTGSSQWICQHVSLSGGVTANSSTFTLSGYTQAIYLNLTNAAASYAFDAQVNGASGTYVAYCFSAVSGYSAFGKYTGNGSSTDGPFVFTGFRPRFVLFKNASASATPWIIFDTTRNTYNEANLSLQPEVSDAEKTNNGWNIDILSNGFKVRNTSSSVNGSGNTITFAAFAEVPYNFARAR